MLWYAVMSMSSGVIHAIVEGIPTSANIRYVVEAARLATIEDARLRQEAIEFYRSCYVSARSKFHEERPDSPAIDRILAEYGHSDPEWMGSHIYRDTPGYYDTYRAGTPHRRMAVCRFTRHRVHVDGPTTLGDVRTAASGGRTVPEAYERSWWMPQATPLRSLYCSSIVCTRSP